MLEFVKIRPVHNRRRSFAIASIPSRRTLQGFFPLALFPYLGYFAGNHDGASTSQHRIHLPLASLIMASQRFALRLCH